MLKTLKEQLYDKNKKIKNYYNLWQMLHLEFLSENDLTLEEFETLDRAKDIICKAFAAEVMLEIFDE